MKSALELAMERLAKDGEEVRALPEEKKEVLQGIDTEFKAKVAEVEIMSGQRIAEARAAGDKEKVQELETAKVAEISRLRRQAEKAKDKVRRR